MLYWFVGCVVMVCSCVCGCVLMWLILFGMVMIC